MPLLPGQSNLQANIAELMRSYHAKGTIGTSTPRNKTLAQRQSIAIAYKKAGETGYGK